MGLIMPTLSIVADGFRFAQGFTERHRHVPAYKAPSARQREAVPRLRSRKAERCEDATELRAALAC